MRIRWTGPRVTRRIVDAHEWSQATGFVQDVADAELAAELLTDPSGQFTVDSEDALLSLKGIGEQRAVELAVAGVATPADIAALDEDGILRVAQEIRVNARQVRAWVDSLTPGPSP